MARKRKSNQFQILGNGTAEIYLTQGKIAIVDWVDLPRILQWTWSANPTGRFWRAMTRNKPVTAKNLLMHRLLLNAPDDMQVDHINSNELDNRRINIRLATSAENQYNNCKRKGTSSRYKGVSWNKEQQRWIAYIRFKNVQYFLGYYENEEGAAHAYNVEATRCFGAFARLNEI